MRPQDWAFLAAALFSVFAVSAALSGAPRAALAGAFAAVAASWASHRLSLRYPGPMSHRFGWILLVPRGFHSPQRLLRMLQLRAAERVLEIGPGVGVYALPVAQSLAPAGILHVLDIQPPMLQHLLKRAGGARLVNIAPVAGDGRTLPYATASFDAAYLTEVLGETTDVAKVLQELRRVLRPGARLVVGEHFLDPDFVRLRFLKETAKAAGFSFERKTGSSLVYYATFRPDPRYHETL